MELPGCSPGRGEGGRLSQAAGTAWTEAQASSAVLRTTPRERLENFELKREARRDTRVVEDGSEQVEPSIKRSV